MIIAGFLGQDTAPVVAPAIAPPAVPASAPVAPAPSPAPTITPPVAASNATRAPFTRPSQATANFMPRSLDTGFIPEFETFPMVMLPQMPRVPQGVRNPNDAGAELRTGGAPTAGDRPADASGQSSLPAGVPSPVKMRSGRMFPPSLIMALGIMPPVRGVRTGRVNPSQLIAAGRKPGMV